MALVAPREALKTYKLCNNYQFNLRRFSGELDESFSLIVEQFRTFRRVLLALDVNGGFVLSKR